ncbi:MAG: pyruvate kinase [archaeon]
MSTKIIATLGPSSSSAKIIKSMFEAGMDIARINTKYGTQKEYSKLLEILTKQKCKVLFDIKGFLMLPWLKDKKFDYLAVSFAESADQIEGIRVFFGRKIKIIAKIETRKGFNHIDELIRASDGIMVARGDLGKNLRIEEVPIYQKLIIKECNKKKKFVVTATEMLLSMTDSKIPVRAEVSDVANAVLDGSNAVMLSEETAIGHHPTLVVRTMNSIVKETEKKRRLLK